jgi:hypothetical protein
MSKINVIMADLTKQKTDQENQLALLNSLKSNQVAQETALQQSQQYKNRLVNNDYSALSDLNASEASANAQVAELQKEINAAYQSYGGGSSGSAVAIKHRSSSGPQLDVPYYSQQDSNWASMSLGDSGVSVGDYGCLITSYAMVASFYGMGKTPADIDNESSFTGDGSFINFDYDMGSLNNYKYRQSVNLNVIDSQLSSGHPVIVGIHISSQFDHWIVLTGGDQNDGYSWNDPYPWRNPPTYTSFFAMRTF